MTNLALPMPSAHGYYKTSFLNNNLAVIKYNEFFSKLFNFKQNNHNKDASCDCTNFYLNRLECTLTPGQLILIDWTQKTGRNFNFPGYFKYSLQINPISTHNQLYKVGYFTRNKTLSYLKVAKLKKNIIKT